MVKQNKKVHIMSLIFIELMYSFNFLKIYLF